MFTSDNIRPLLNEPPNAAKQTVRLDAVQVLTQTGEVFHSPSSSSHPVSSMNGDAAEKTYLYQPPPGPGLVSIGLHRFDFWHVPSIPFPSSRLAFHLMFLPCAVRVA